MTRRECFRRLGLAVAALWRGRPAGGAAGTVPVARTWIAESAWANTVTVGGASVTFHWVGSTESDTWTGLPDA